MFIIQSYAIAVFFCIITMLCWGSWANTQKLASKEWRFELFYWDYTIGILLTTLLLAFTLGNDGTEGRSFIKDIQQASNDNLMSAFSGGVLFNLANILLVAAIAIAGMSVAFPVGIGIALVLGVLLNYINQPTGNAIMLFSGVVLIAFAIILNAKAYKQSGKGSAITTKGLLLSIVSGCLMGLFYKYVAASIATDFSNPEAGKLTPYTALLIFAVGVFISNFIFNTYIMMKPFAGLPVSFSNYFKGKLKDHLIGVFGGFVWCIGMSFSIIASGKAGAAISYGLGQGATVVAAIWGIFVWKEFQSASSKTKTMLNIMLLLYVIGLGCIIVSRN